MQGERIDAKFLSVIEKFLRRKGIDNTFLFTAGDFPSNGFYKKRLAITADFAVYQNRYENDLPQVQLV